ncbi:beta-ketoacyl synthase N-terminal-like domain-containing protein [Pseudoalteromonas sp. Of7M-16]|uniref:beta-ketoacyl synthase N-terminal-like domain-containing protein n=1 Tax=Pseudoalteromonas sp. Of7M-16 TaxID=2917756 RepID=UPI001EF6D9DA|nr:beta-ketoacyl synthase N-terminal-like domain-containing protein [Pseudoalteromonas sp. Of7M-16]MCG7548784.1 AMP-binding protein [Pseudoalteromonas sp. Of7M-16]
MKQEQEKKQLIDTCGAPLWESVIDFIAPFKKKELFATPADDNTLDVITGTNLIEHTQRLGSVLSSMLGSQQKIIILFPQGMEYVYSLLACWYANLAIIPIPLGDLTQKDKLSETLDRIIADSAATCILTNTEISQQLAESEKLKDTQVLDINQLNCDDQKITLERPKQPDDLAILLYSSGSNSQPKGVQIPHQSLESQINIGAQQWEINGDSRITSWMPQFHSFGLVFGILAPLSRGAFSVIFDAKYFLLQPNLWFERISLYQATHTAAPNFALDYCVNKVNIDAFLSSEQKPLASLKAIVCGGEPFNYDSYVNFNTRFECLGLNPNAVTCCYGLSEVCSVVSGDINSKERFMSLDIESLEQDKVQPTERANKAKTVASCGKISGDTSVTIVEKGTLTPCKKGMVGEILVHSPSIAAGYLNRPDESSSTFSAKVANSEKNFLRTGDLGFVEDGYLYVVGREKDVIIINGKNHHPIDIEASIKRHVDYLKLAMIVFSQVIDNEEKVIVVQEVKDGLSQADYHAIVADIKQAIAQNHSIRAHEIHLVPEKTIPRTGSGKIQKQACRNLRKADTLPAYYCDTAHQTTATNTATAPDSANIAAIIETLKNTVFASELNLTQQDLANVDDLSAIMLDSIQYVVIAKKIEEVFKTAFAPVMLFKYPSFSQLAGHLHEALSSLSQSTEVQNDVVEGQHQEADQHKYNEQDKDAIAIVGMSGHFPGGATDLDLFWDNLIHQNDSISAIPTNRQAFSRDKKASELNGFPNRGGFLYDIDTFDAEFFGISPLEANSMDPQQRKVMEMTWSVFESAGHNPKQLADQNVGLFIGAHNNDYLELTLAQPELTEKYGAYLDSGVHMSMIANRASRWFDFNGPSEVINTACSSSLVAVHHAVESIKNGTCNLAVAGGINLILTPRVYKAAHSAGMLSADGSCKTFDEKANGFVRAEGYGAVLLKPYHQAIKDNDTIYGVIRSAVTNHDGKSNSLRAPNLDSQTQLIKSAYQAANIAPESVSYIEAHGTGTPLGDPIETEALKEAFNALSDTLPHQYCGLGTAKTNIGHCESAAGIAGLIKVLLSMKHQTLPGVLHFNQLNPSISLQQSPFYVVDKTQPWQRLTDASGEPIPLRAGISSFGFGGVNAHVVVEEPIADNVVASSNHEAAAQLILLSAKTPEQLMEVASGLHSHLIRQSINDTFNSQQTLLDIAYTLQVGRHDMQERLAIIVDTPIKLMDALYQFLSGTSKRGNFYRGAVDKELESLNWDSDEGLTTAFNHWFEVKALHKVASFWVRGATPSSWHSLHKNTRPKRINLPSYPFTQSRYWLPDLPKLSSMQPDAVNASHTQKPLPQAARVAVTDDITQNVLSAVSESTELPIQNINTSVDLGQLGVDSILRLKITNQLIKMYPDCSIEVTEILVLQTIDDIVQLLQEKTGKTGVTVTKKSVVKSSAKQQSSAQNGLSHTIKEMVSRHTDHAIKALDPSLDLTELGVDSITRLKLTNDIIQAFPALSLEPAQLLPLSTINEISELLNKATAQTAIQSERAVTQVPEYDENAYKALQEISHNLKQHAGNIIIKNVKPDLDDANTLRADTIVCEDHPFFNDHPLDHITGVQLIESTMQLIKASELNRTNASEYYTQALTIQFDAFCEHDSAELFCTEVNDDQITGSKSFSTRVTQFDKNICQAKVTIQQISSSADAPLSDSALADDASPCDRSTVNKHNGDNVFISTATSAWDQSGVWFMPNHSDTIFNDNSAGVIDVTHLIEGCRQHQRSMGKLLSSQSTAQDSASNASAALKEGVGILKSLEIRLHRALQKHESIFITNGDMNVLEVGGNRIINWQSDLLVNGEVVGIYKMESLALSNEVYRSWRSAEEEKVAS